MNNRFFATISVMVIVLAVIWLLLFKREGVELILVLLSIIFAVLTLFLIYLNERNKK